MALVVYAETEIPLFLKKVESFSSATNEPLSNFKPVVDEGTCSYNEESKDLLRGRQLDL